MFFKGIKDKLKRRSAQKYMQQTLAKGATEVKRKKGIKKVGCIVDLDVFDTSDAFYELLEEFKLPPNAVKIIGYKRVYDKNSPYATPVFSDQDLGWNGDIENSYVLEFLNREYDIVINYYQENHLMLNLLSLKTRARLKVGFKEIGTEYNDLMLANNLSDFKTFKTELKKYLVVLKEL